MSTADVVAAEPRVVNSEGQALWFLGTLAQMKLVGAQTGGRFGLWESVCPQGAAPPLHSHPQDETFYVLDGEITVWVVEPDELRDGDRTWVKTHARRCGPGSVMFAPGGTPHTFRVETGTAKMLVISTPAGIEDLVHGLAEPAAWPWLPPPADGPRADRDRRVAIERETGMVIYAPPPVPPEPALRSAADGVRRGSRQPHS
jgi:quercetin dioxygenase-like cupin family protein